MHSQPVVSHSQDQSTQAMTEVALALSMAFFSLLLLALVSIGVPETNLYNEGSPRLSPEEKTMEFVPEFVLQESIENTSETIENIDKLTEEKDETQYIFYYQSKFYDQYLQPIQISHLNLAQNVVVALPSDTDVSTALELQQYFKAYNVTLTLMDKDWLAAFSNHEVL